MDKNKTRSGVYFIKNNSTGLIKIGCSNNIDKRFKSIEGEFTHLGIDCDISLIDYIITNENNIFNLESFIHKQFKHKRIKGEWFLINNDDVTNIKKIVFETKYGGLNNEESNTLSVLYKFLNLKFQHILKTNTNRCFMTNELEDIFGKNIEHIKLNLKKLVEKDIIKVMYFNNFVAIHIFDIV